MIFQPNHHNFVINLYILNHLILDNFWLAITFLTKYIHAINICKLYQMSYVDVTQHS